MKIEILGSGCASCDNLHKNAVDAVKQAGLEDQIEVVKMKDPGYFLERKVYQTPGLIIDDQVVSTGQVLNVDEIKEIMSKTLS